MSYYKQTYISDGTPARAFRLASRSLLDYRRLGVMVNRVDRQGHRIPFRLRFCSLKGELIEWSNVICTSRNPRARTHTYLSIESHNYRTVKDALVLMIDNTKIVVE
jgi:hypothetical protein